jgi:Uma2 family endonuclease
MSTIVKRCRKTTKAPAKVPTESPTLADLNERFGPLPMWRIRTNPPPGTATEKDVSRIHETEDRLCELVDGTLVEKDVGYEESLLAGWLLTILNNFVRPSRLGYVAGADGMLNLGTRRVRIPDVSYVSLKRLPGGRTPKEPIPQLIPNLAVEVLSRGNTPQELRRKLADYFKAGVELVWFVDPRSRTVEVFTASDKSEVLTEKQTLTGGTVLPGFKLKLRELFSILDE